MFLTARSQLQYCLFFSLFLTPIIALFKMPEALILLISCAIIRE